MLGLGPKPFNDQRLGMLHRSRGKWRGTVPLAGRTDVPLALSGPRSAPDPEALSIARSLQADFPAWQPEIAQALLDHYRPWAEDTENPVPRIANADGVWQHARIEFVQVAPLDGEMTVEIGYRVAWDDEHTLGARLRDGRLVELNGSVLPP